MKTKNDTRTRAYGQRQRGPAASFEAGKVAKIKKGPGGRRKPLIRLNSRKTNAWISFRFFLDLLPDCLGFPSGLIWKRFRPAWFSAPFGPPARRAAPYPSRPPSA